MYLLGSTEDTLNWTDVVVSLALIALVIRQLRPRPLTLPGLLWPVPLVLYAAYDNLQTLPTGPDLQFTCFLGTAGLGLGVLCGFLTRVYRWRGGALLAQATGLAAVLWVAGLGSRLAFAFLAEHGGGTALAHFSEQHRLTMTAWVAGLVLMSLLEVLGRSGVLLWRQQRAQHLVR